MNTHDFQSGEVIADRYRLERLLGEGGIGVVWLAWQTGVERPVAVKFLKGGSGDPDEKQRFDREARVLGRLNHPNCVTVHDFGHWPERQVSYLVTEYLDGVPLDEWSETERSLTDVVEVTKQIVTGLAYAHHQGVVHRDLKPENVFLVESFSGETLVKVLDFGLAKLVGLPNQDITKTGAVAGTPAYMSPEQVKGARLAGAPSDLYSVGVMLYELVEGRLPFWDENFVYIALAHMRDPVPEMERSDVPDDLEQIIYKLLEKDPDDRFQSAIELHKALSAVGLENASPPTMRLAAISADETLPDDDDMLDETVLTPNRAATADEPETVLTPNRPAWEDAKTVLTPIPGLDDTAPSGEKRQPTELELAATEQVQRPMNNFGGPPIDRQTEQAAESSEDDLETRVTEKTSSVDGQDATSWAMLVAVAFLVFVAIIGVLMTASFLLAEDPPAVPESEEAPRRDGAAPTPDEPALSIRVDEALSAADSAFVEAVLVARQTVEESAETAETPSR